MQSHEPAPPTSSSTAPPRPRSSNLEANLQGYTTAQQWNPSQARFDPGDRANELAKAAKSPRQ